MQDVVGSDWVLTGDAELDTVASYLSRNNRHLPGR